ncbi:MAG: hypothetical protein WCJ35_13115 [Planctomycetota bacterium]
MKPRMPHKPADHACRDHLIGCGPMQIEIERDFTPPELARVKGIESEKILTWIRNGELRAVNYATRPTGRPRWRIKAEDWLAFEESRTSKPPVKAIRKTRKSSSHVTEFFT